MLFLLREPVSKTPAALECGTFAKAAEMFHILCPTGEFAAEFVRFLIISLNNVQKEDQFDVFINFSTIFVVPDHAILFQLAVRLEQMV